MPTPRVATPGDAPVLGALLDAFNREFDTPTPGPDLLAQRLETLLAQPEATVALLVEDPPAGFALMTFRPSVWYDGPVVLLDELYVAPAERGHGLGTALLHRAVEMARERGCGNFEINVDEVDTDARRFYERHGFANTEPGYDSRLLYYFREL